MPRKNRKRPSGYLGPIPPIARITLRNAFLMRFLPLQLDDGGLRFYPHEEPEGVKK